jgi:hypothetical protein
LQNIYASLSKDKHIFWLLYFLHHFRTYQTLTN